jgi:hypothetical protein
VVGSEGPIRGATVHLRWAGGATRTTSGPDGTWSVEAGARDEWHVLFVCAAGHASWRQRIDEPSAGSGTDPRAVELHVLELAPEQLVVARLHPSWRGLAQPLYVERLAQDQPWPAETIWSWPDGRIVLRGLGRGRFRLFAPEGWSRDFELDGSRAMLDLGELRDPAPAALPPGVQRG